MSGGSYNYAYHRINELASEIRGNSAERCAFRHLLTKVATALHDIEWVDSGDYGPGDENKAIAACLSPDIRFEAAAARLKKAVVECKEAMTAAETLLEDLIV